MRFKLYMDMAIALKSITENIIKPGRDLVHEISTGFLLENKLNIISALCGSTGTSPGNTDPRSGCPSAPWLDVYKRQDKLRGFQKSGDLF